MASKSSFRSYIRENISDDDHLLPSAPYDEEIDDTQDNHVDEIGTYNLNIPDLVQTASNELENSSVEEHHEVLTLPVR